MDSFYRSKVIIQCIFAKNMEIRHIKREEIDKLKWDSCVHFANNGNLFGYTWYLDNVAKEWDGLVEGDYQSVFPLIKKNEQSLHIPNLIPKSGIYSIHILSPKRIRNFLEKIPVEFRQRKIAFTELIQLKGTDSFSNHEDFQLNLNEEYIDIQSKYKPELIVALDKAEEKGYMLDAGLKPEAVADFYLQHHPKATEANKHAYLRIMYNLLHRGTGFVSAMKDDSGQLAAVDFFTFSHGKIVSLIPTSAGKQHLPALFKLTDLLVQTHAGKPNFLDFNITMGNVQPALFNAEKINYSHLNEDFRPSWKKWLPF